ncbi:MAG: NDP-sugar synthase [Deltaproteobacteria bacterium]|nr:NDP-sugar synthase [Deltaproteobacteria bacterium]
MKGMILAAGFGMRLEPLTSYLPKPLVPVGNRAVIDRSIDYLKAHGIDEIVVNAHRHAEKLKAHLDGGDPFKLKVQVRVEPEILGTGGGIRNTLDFWDDNPFVVINGDILTDIDLTRVYETHIAQGNRVTLILHDYAPFNQVRVDKEMNIREISVDPGPGKLAFTGIHIIDPAVLGRIPGGVFFDILECYRSLIKDGGRIKGYLSAGHYWRDIGSFNHYLLANQEAAGRERFLVGMGCRVSSTAQLHDWAVIGDRSVLGERADVARSVLWRGVRVHPAVRVVDSVVTSQKEIREDVINRAL